MKITYKDETDGTVSITWEAETREEQEDLKDVALEIVQSQGHGSVDDPEIEWTGGR